MSNSYYDVMLELIMEPTYEDMIVPHFECGVGWEPLVHEALQVVSGYALDDRPIEVIRIIEKFGRLHVRVDLEGLEPDVADRIDAWMDAFKARSSEICVVCEKPG